MKKTFLIALLAVNALLITSCSDAVSSEPNDELLFGTWVFNSYGEDNVQTMLRSDKLEDDKYGFIFYHDGRFVERKNNSWCGTPPVVYSNYDGSWEEEPDSIINITAGFWGGIAENKIKIISLTESELKFVNIYQ